MESRIINLFGEVLPIFQEWVRTTVSEEVTKALEADRMKSKPEKMLSREEVCQILGVSLPTLWAKTKSGEIKAQHIGRRILYAESEVNRFCGK